MCILQTCLDLLAQDIQVHIVVDAVSSQRPLDREVALSRMQHSGAYLTTVESILFLLAKDSKHKAFKTVSSLLKKHNAVENAFQMEKI